MLVEGLERSGLPEGNALAASLAARWLASNLKGWGLSGGRMHEKYDATRPGQRGAGGEYAPQVGFGWTNGVVLWMLERYAGTKVVAGLDGEDGAAGGSWIESLRFWALMVVGCFLTLALLVYAHCGTARRATHCRPWARRPLASEAEGARQEVCDVNNDIRWS